MPNFIRFEKTTEIGDAKRGKYTFPKIPAFETKVLDVLLKQSEK